jgi:hypothetical protein
VGFAARQKHFRFAEPLRHLFLTQDDLAVIGKKVVPAGQKTITLGVSQDPVEIVAQVVWRRKILRVWIVEKSNPRSHSARVMQIKFSQTLAKKKIWPPLGL